MKKMPKSQKLKISDDSQNHKMILKTEEEWKEKLAPEQFHVLRGKGTERPFTGKLLNNKEKGIYTCAACGSPLFKSDANCANTVSRL